MRTWFYLPKINGQLLPESEAVLSAWTEEEQLKTEEITNGKCPGFSYCMEMFLIQDRVRDLGALTEGQVTERVMHDIEYDALK